jgi:hypothetical protein
MVKSRKKNTSSSNDRSKGIRTRKKYNMSGGLTALQTYGNTQYSSTMATKALSEERKLQDQFADPKIIKGYLHDSRYGTKYGSSSFLKIYNNLLSIRKDNINSLRSINGALSELNDSQPEVTHKKAYPRVKELHKQTTEERYNLIRVQDDEIKNHFKQTAYKSERKKDRLFNELSKSIHELRKIVLQAFYTLVKTENNHIYISLGSVVKQSSNKFSENTPGRSFI